MGEKRTITLRVRVTPDERQRIETLAAGLSLSEYMRSCALNVEGNNGAAEKIARLERRLISERERLASLTIDPESHRQLMRIGNNLNQIARAINRANIREPLDVASFALQLDGIRRELVEYRLIREREIATSNVEATLSR